MEKENINNFDAVVNQASFDQDVNIAIGQLTHDAEICFYGAHMKADSKVSCHYHKHGEEIYHIISGHGEIHLADIDSNHTTSHYRSFAVKEGDTFSIPRNTAHQLKAKTDLRLLFSCPQAHVKDDRHIIDDLT